MIATILQFYITKSASNNSTRVFRRRRDFLIGYGVMEAPKDCSSHGSQAEYPRKKPRLAENLLIDFSLAVRHTGSSLAVHVFFSPPREHRLPDS
mmetsp:Transcript_10851/g.30141  ORF Transcript_10851/g.30141 Transcript_10851/m.30141 type:complete len:94 (+) Transcript_10851:766-1047(+)